MAILDTLLEHFKELLKKQKELEAENLQLREEVRIFKKTEEIRQNLKQEQEANMQEITAKLEKLLTLK